MDGWPNWMIWIQIRRAMEEYHLTHDWPKIAAGDEDKRTTASQERGVRSIDLTALTSAPTGLQAWAQA
jgi:hypothetical protein